ncbi:MAG: MBL fold metallo-hydrolase [Candidatus Thermoplasmatota archaeon]|jgi:glyoxylase-like metal-dependent hydrolase (beta-lactamase superfamily II)
MILQPYYLGCLSHASYLLGDTATKTAIVVDPQRDIDQYVRDAQRLGLTIRHVVLTHFHADFLAGHLELRERTGATIHLGHRAQADYPFTRLHEGPVWDFPRLRVDVLETPGHTPEMVSLVLYDKAESMTEPQAVLTGDTLFNGDVGRPDLVASRGFTAETLAGMLFESLQKLKALPDATKVLPAHGAGSSCGKSIAGLETTIGEQKAMNAAFKLEDRAAFVQAVTHDLPPPPAYFAVDAELNRRERGVLDDTLAQDKPLPTEAALALANQGAQLVDTRSPKTFAQTHLAGSINVGIDGNYAPWAGAVLDAKRSIVLIAEPGRVRESILRLGRIGFDSVAGHLATPLEDVAQTNPDAVVSTPRARPDDAVDLARKGLHVLDVRTASEHAALRLAGSQNVPLAELSHRLGDVPRDRPVLVHCASGYRSSIAASLLRKAGWTQIYDVEGGLNALALAPDVQNLLETHA